MKTYTAFFNTEPQIGTVVVGITAGLEVASNGAADVDDENDQWFACRFDGTFGGYRCDSLIVGTLIPDFTWYRTGLIPFIWAHP